MNKYSRSINVMILLLLLAACRPADAGGEPTAVPEARPARDDATGLELNPVVPPEGKFVVEGVITAVNLIPQDAPLIKIVTENGQNYQILTQPVSQITDENGTAVPALEIKNGLVVRATVQQNETGGLGGEPVLSSDDLIIFLSPTE